jgi:hypothetical protein
MPIQLSQDERAFLEQVVRPFKPTKRQKAHVLLGLAAGEPPEAVAARVGLPKEVVTELAARFAEDGLAGVGLSKKPQTVVFLLRPGVGLQRCSLPEGSTLTDLLSRTRATTKGQTVFVNDIIAEESLVLPHKAVVTIVPASNNVASGEPQQGAVPSLRDDLIFEQYRDILKVRRKALAQEEGSGE